MKALKKLFPFIILTFITLFFFRNVFLNNLIPFPGDLLVSQYQPFRSYSYLGYNPGAVPNKAQYFDTIREFYPWRTLVNRQIRKQQLPFWNPYNFAGSPLLANYQTAVFYPLNFFYLIFNQVTAWTILIILQSFLASFFTYLYARKIGINFYGALLSSIAFAYSFYMNTWLEFNTIGHTILWLPLILYSIEKITRGIQAKSLLRCPWSVILVLSLTASLFAGHPIDFAVIYLFSAVYLIFKIIALKITRKNKLKSFIIYSFLFIIPLLIGSIQLLPTIELLKNSTRVSFEFEFFINKMLIQPFQLIMLFIPDFFGNPATRNFYLSSSYVGLTLSIGLTPLLLVSFLILNLKKMKNDKKLAYIKFFLIFSTLMLLFMVNTPFTKLFYKLKIPLVLTSSPTKLLSVFAFSLSILAGFGMDFYLSEKKLKPIIKSIFPFIIVFFLAWISLKFIPPEHFRVSFRNTIYSTVILIISIIIFLFGKFFNKIYIKKLSVCFLIIISVFDLSRSFNKFNPFSPREFIFPETKVLNFLKENAGINRFWGYGTAKIDSNIASQYEIFSTDGFDALNLSWYNKFISSSKNGKIKTEFSHIDRSIAEIAPGYGKEDLPNNTYRLKILDMLGVKYILDRIENPKDENTFAFNRFKLVWEDNAGWRIFENLKSAPRFFLTDDIKTYKTNQEFEKIFFSSNFNPSKTILIYEDDLNHLNIKPDYETIKNSIVYLKTYKPNKVVFEVKTDAESFLFLSDTFDFGWQAYIDGKENKIYKTNYAFRSVLVPKGKHQITFIYKPSIFKRLL